MGTPLGPKYLPYSYMDPLGVQRVHVGAIPELLCLQGSDCSRPISFP